MGKSLAEKLLSRDNYKLPVTLVGFGLGARIIYYCLEEMSTKENSEGIILDVMLFGAPVVC
ncbi:hypothetical protein Phum_PHUM040020 [Pediculus humanus corporis]|uniref:Uncharacterized protein n=1 Tax=Pediculus humanus subsp. corporis TaxID=121224 RepID=E0VAK2_PEDHC|nr:uncharacterized protein Phum_PHUM040020 [Pediculus humanus corporis]EEB10408.1 hypothetical protein Phum_PHUM040020 [Pediculus humanus corporis]